MIKVIGFKKLKSDKKKYEITFEKNGKKYKRKFGSAGMSDFTIHKDKERRERYISRHKKDLRTKDPMKPGYLSMYILWNKPTLKGSLADYKKRLGVYNRTGKFPTGITGSKKLSFGTSSIIPVKGTLFDKLPPEVFDSMLQEPRSAALIQKNIRKRLNSRQKITNMLKRLGEQRFARNGERRFLTDLKLNYRVTTREGRLITQEMTRLLTKDDFLNKSFWWELVDWGLMQLEEVYYDVGVAPDDIDLTFDDFETPEEYMNFTINENILIDFVTRSTGISFDDRDEGNKRWIAQVRNSWLFDVDTNSFGKKKPTKGSKIPDNVVNKALYSRIKAKIRRDVNKKKRRWGAYDSGRLVREYKAKGGKYSGSKGKTNLGRWYKEKWVDACAWPKRKACGRKTKEKIAYCRPSKKVDSKTPKLVQKLTKAQIKSRCEKKKKSPLKRVTKFGDKKK